MTVYCKFIKSLDLKQKEHLYFMSVRVWQNYQLDEQLVMYDILRADHFGQRRYFAEHYAQEFADSTNAPKNVRISLRRLCNTQLLVDDWYVLDGWKKTSSLRDMHHVQNRLSISPEHMY